MSRWLSQVTNYLEQLDDQAQDYVEENINAPLGEEASGEQNKSNLDTILAQRGLAAPTDDDEDDDVDLDFLDEDPFGSSATAVGAANSDDEPAKDVIPPKTTTASDAAEAATSSTTTVTETKDPVDVLPTTSTTTPTTKEPQQEQSGQPSSEESDKKEAAGASVNPTNNEATISLEEVANKLESTVGTSSGESVPDPKKDAATNEKDVTDEVAKDGEKPPQQQTATMKSPPKPVPPTPARTPAKAEEHSNTKAETKPKKTHLPPPAAPNSAPTAKTSTQPSAPAPAPAPTVTTLVKDPNPALVKEAKEAQKEVRTLRRHMLALNQQLESVESEVTAQRKELDEVGGRMEKERAKAKEQRDKERKLHADELKKVQALHEATLMDQKTRLEKQLADMSQKLLEMEQTRMQEGGNWDKELQGAVEREQLLEQSKVALEDEKEILLSQIATLQSQQEALGDRIDSLSQTADSAMEREREAEERLDQALSVHAHQISQRQARESELERTIAELGAAVVRNKESSRLADYNKKGSELSDTAGENTSQDSGLRMRLDMALHDLETAQGNLDLERQRTEALQRELREINSERTEEVTNARIKQNKHDRQIADLTLQLTRLQQQSNCDAVREGSERKESSGDDKKEVQGLKSQIKELSEEVLKARDKMGGYSSEIAALKSRLKGANDRAEKAESALEENALSTPSIDSLDRMERGAPTSGNSVRRRGGGAGRNGPTTITSAMHLNKTERVGKAVDALDSFSVSTGKYLRYNPMARAAFIMYLLMLHLWTFVVIFFHAHNFEDIHRDDLPHGPGAIMQNQLGAGGQAVQAAVKAAAAKQKP